MTKSADDYLAELRPYIDRWAIATQEEREIRRRRATPAELNTFYQVFSEDAVWECDGFGRYEGRDVIANSPGEIGQKDITWTLHYMISPIL